MAHIIARLVLAGTSLTMLLVIFAVSNANPALSGLATFILLDVTIVAAIGLFLSILATDN